MSIQLAATQAGDLGSTVALLLLPGPVLGLVAMASQLRGSKVRRH
ncbi:MAG: hypothetical protein ACR2JD_09615 [Nocardioides sp.]